MKKRWMSFLLAAVMAVSVLVVPAYADVAAEYGVSVTFGEPVGIGVQSKDKWGYKSYIKNNDYMNVSVYPLSDAPEMDFVKTIEGVTFSNYIRHVERETTDEAGEPIKVYQVYVGLGASMRSDRGAVEFMTSPGTPFNNVNNHVGAAKVKLSNKNLLDYNVHPCSDLNMYKTNTAFMASSWVFDGKNGLAYLYDIGITPYTNGERNMDGTWNEGLTWVFGRCDDLGKKSNGSYGAVYPVRVNQGDDVTYFQVAVTDNTNYMGERTGDRAGEVIPTVTAKPTTSAVYMDGIRMYLEAYNINGNNYFKLRDVAYALRNTVRRFQVTWEPDFETVMDGEAVRGAVNMTSNTTYTPVGGEIMAGDGKEKIGQPTRSAILKDGVQVTSVAGYNIGGNNFFKLRDLGELFDFNVSWDAKLGSIIVNGNERYDPTT